MLRQAMRKFSIEFVYDKGDVNLLDEWLKSVLKIEVKIAKQDLESIIERNLILINELFQIVKVPCFSKGTILSIDKIDNNTNRYKADIKISDIEYLHENYYTTVISFSINSILWMLKTPVNDSSILELYQLIEKNVISKLNGVVGSGKSTIGILKNAYEKDIPFMHLSGGVYQLGWGSSLRLINRSVTDLDSVIGATIANNKMISSNMIGMSGLPSPVNALVSDVDMALQIAKKIKWPVVLKPVDGDRGEGVTINVNSPEKLIIAFEHAKRYSQSKRVIVEREVLGVVHRVFVVKGEVLYVVKRVPKAVIGDAINSVSELIKIANRDLDATPPWLRSEIFKSDTEAIEAMNAFGFTMESIPKVDERVPLRMIESTVFGGGSIDASTQIHKENIRIALQATKLTGLEIAGIDIITQDISKPWYENGAIINEINVAPVLGGSEVSKQNISKFLDRVIVQNGRIPVSIFVGGERAMKEALKKQKKSIKKRVSCYLTSHDKTLDKLSSEMIYTNKSLYKRVKSLLINKEVEELIIVLQTDEILLKGLPLDKVDDILFVDEELKSIISNKEFSKSDLPLIELELEKLKQGY